MPPSTGPLPSRRLMTSHWVASAPVRRARGPPRGLSKVSSSYGQCTWEIFEPVAPSPGDKNKYEWMLVVTAPEGLKPDALYLDCLRRRVGSGQRAFEVFYESISDAYFSFLKRFRLTQADISVIEFDEIIFKHKPYSTVQIEDVVDLEFNVRVLNECDDADLEGQVSVPRVPELETWGVRRKAPKAKRRDRDSSRERSKKPRGGATLVYLVEDSDDEDENAPTFTNLSVALTDEVLDFRPGRVGVGPALVEVVIDEDTARRDVDIAVPPDVATKKGAHSLPIFDMAPPGGVYDLRPPNRDLNPGDTPRTDNGEEPEKKEEKQEEAEDDGLDFALDEDVGVEAEVAIPTVVEAAPAENDEPRAALPFDLFDDADVVKSRKPIGCACWQQNWNAWRPSWETPWRMVTILIMAILLASVAASLGIALPLTLTEVSVRYDNNASCEANFITGETTRTDATEGNRECSVSISLSQDMTKPVFLYYEVTNFVQSHRRYLSSLSPDQLASRDGPDLEGCTVTASETTDDLVTAADYRVQLEISGTTVNPCGALPLSFFNDTIEMSDSSGNSVSFKSHSDYTYQNKPTPRDTAWDTDVSGKFKKSTPQWTNGIAILRNGVEDERFITWCRQSVGSHWRKLYAVIDADLGAGDYTFTIRNRWPAGFGSKSLVLSGATVMGGKNFSLGIVAAIHVFAWSLLLFVVVLLLVVAPRPDPEILLVRLIKNMEERGDIATDRDLPDTTEMKRRKSPKSASTDDDSMDDDSAFNSNDSLDSSSESGTHRNDYTRADDNSSTPDRTNPT